MSDWPNCCSEVMIGGDGSVPRGRCRITVLSSDPEAGWLTISILRADGVLPASGGRAPSTPGGEGGTESDLGSLGCIPPPRLTQQLTAPWNQGQGQSGYQLNERHRPAGPPAAHRTGEKSLTPS